MPSKITTKIEVLAHKINKQEIETTVHLLIKSYGAMRLSLSNSQRASFIDVVKLLEATQVIKEKQDDNTRRTMLLELGS